MEDTWKLIAIKTNSLRKEIPKYQGAAVETAKGLAAFGIQCICDKITLIKSSLCSPTKWQIVELRGAIIPVTWDSRTGIMPVFELLVTFQANIFNYKNITIFIYIFYSVFQNEYDLQKNILKKLRRENSFFDPIDEKESIQDQFGNTDLLE
ncbi:uncharacterized protein RHIMIDRAFT_238389 [Rhizopus microsporus ATCC 52813]|uniref:Uncharacterized protein n=2 Tax=Rhizopus microsporus TaxID=58291 RepID=A0A2G4SSI0_RHIZD|nr:uncharacterized protein RHIMIDRAFT_238389 [Rhizopus microsporus ATCC 52813]PHZ11723.1 hypothetical protein RHIMIDRAFT_238389 [Rhizopus microsporus ATCC 52813]